MPARDTEPDARCNHLEYGRLEGRRDQPLEVRGEQGRLGLAPDEQISSDLAHDICPLQRYISLDPQLLEDGVLREQLRPRVLRHRLLVRIN